MIRSLDIVASEFGVAVEELVVWIDRRWIQPVRCGEELTFDDADLARLRMILDFSRDLAIDQETMPIVLGLLDRLYATRVQLRMVLEAVAELPDPVRTSMIKRFGGEPGQ
jgi:chaperone modulatory protein CbpM